MSPRLIAILMLTLSAVAMATETTTQAVVEEIETNAEVVAEETQATVEAMADEATAEADAALEETEAAAEEMADEAQAAVEETEAAVEEMADEATAEADAAVEETEAAVEEMADEATTEADTAVEETEAAVEEMADEATAEADAAVEEMAEETAEAEQAAGVVDVQAKVAACAACHGADGNSVIPQNPKLAGQVPGFIADQLSKFKSGERDNAIMTAQVANLTDEDMKAIDAHYSAQEPQLGAISEDMLEEALIGEKIFRGGEPSMSISACMSCHGPNGDGIPIRFPRVSGQHAEYLEQTLLAYKSGSRKSDVMNSIAFRLSEQQIKSLALYMHGLK